MGLYGMIPPPTHRYERSEGQKKIAQKKWERDNFRIITVPKADGIGISFSLEEEKYNLGRRSNPDYFGVFTEIDIVCFHLFVCICIV